MLINNTYLGDCLELMQGIEDKSIDMICTDPPYLMSYKTNRRLDKLHRFCSVIEGDNDKSLIRNFIKESFRVLKDNTAFYMFCNSNEIDFFAKEVKKWFKIKNIIVWVKNNWTAGDLVNAYGKQYEFIIYANKGNKAINGKRITDVWACDKVAGNKQIHQNQKPLLLLKKIIEKSTKEGDLILDCFAGSGSLGIAALNMNRNFILMEKDETYFNIANKRIEEHKDKLQQQLFSKAI